MMSQRMIATERPELLELSRSLSAKKFYNSNVSVNSWQSQASTYINYRSDRIYRRASCRAIIKVWVFRNNWRSQASSDLR